MSIITSKPQKSHNLIDPIFVLFLTTVILLMFIAAFAGNLESTLDSWLVTFDDARANLSADSTPSFAADQRYWEANCSQSWSSGSMCEDIVLRSQSCVISVDSAYCSAYENYMKQFTDR